MTLTREDRELLIRALSSHQEALRSYESRSGKPTSLTIALAKEADNAEALAERIQEDLDLYVA